MLCRIKALPRKWLASKIRAAMNVLTRDANIFYSRRFFLNHLFFLTTIGGMLLACNQGSQTHFSEIYRGRSTPDAEEITSEKIDDDSVTEEEAPSDTDEDDLVLKMVPHDPSPIHEHTIEWSINGYNRTIVEDDWHEDAAIYNHSFDVLTPLGKKIFEAMHDHVENQRHEDFEYLAQPLQCAHNVTHVLSKVGYKFDELAQISIPHLTAAIIENGGVAYDVPRYDPEKDNREEILEFFQTNFPHSIPTGALVVGCITRNCNESELSGGHVALVGDKNEFGEILLYHNNWLNPNHNQGLRTPYMVSPENFYVHLRPREWMATPWLYLSKNEKGDIHDIISVTPSIQDFHIYGQYTIQIVLTKEMREQIEEKGFLAVHNNIASGNIHKNKQVSDEQWELCITNHGLRHLKPRFGPYNENNFLVLNTLKKFPPLSTFFDVPFEFAVIEEIDGWVSALAYSMQRYWGSNDHLGPLWIKKDQVQCRERHNIFLASR